jgi:hypothetical protein
MEQVLERDPVGCALRNAPRGPADEPVDGVAPLRLVQRELPASPVELVAAVRDPVRPRDQELAAPRAAELGFGVAVQNRPTTGRVRAQATAHLHQDGPLVFERELDLLA